VAKRGEGDVDRADLERWIASINRVPSDRNDATSDATRIV
jgi:hypothetical protein